MAEIDEKVLSEGIKAIEEALEGVLEEERAWWGSAVRDLTSSVLGAVRGTPCEEPVKESIQRLVARMAKKEGIGWPE